MTFGLSPKEVITALSISSHLKSARVTQPSHQPGHFRLLCFIPNLTRRMFAAADRSQRQKISVLPLPRGEKDPSWCTTAAQRQGAFLSGHSSQFSQVPDASNVTDIWIQFLQRKNLRHFNPFGGSKSRRKRKHPLHSWRIHFHCCVRTV